MSKCVKKENRTLDLCFAERFFNGGFPKVGLSKNR